MQTFVQRTMQGLSVNLTNLCGVGLLSLTFLSMATLGFGRGSISSSSSSSGYGSLNRSCLVGVSVDAAGVGDSTCDCHIAKRGGVGKLIPETESKDKY